MSQKTILQVCAYAAPYAGNFIASLRKLACGNSKLGYQTVFAFPHTAAEMPWCKELEAEYVVYYLPLARARLKPQTYRLLRDIYKKHNVEIVHSHFELYDMPATVTAPKNTRVFWHLHDALDLIYEKSGTLYRLLWRLQYGVVSKRAMLLSVSEKGKRFAVSLGFQEKNTCFLPNAIDMERLDASTGKLDSEYDFLIFGWDYKRKGVDILSDAVTKTNTADYLCGVVANDEVNEKIKDVPHLMVQEPVSDVGALYRSTKCFLHISRHEGLSYALLEAIYYGCTVICSDIEQNLFAKVFPTVFFVPVEDSDALAAMMDKACQDELSVTQETVEASRQIISQEYSLESWVKRVQKYYFS